MNFPEHLCEVGKKRRRKILSSGNGASGNIFYSESETINSLDRIGNASNPHQAGVDPPFILNQPQPYRPAKKEVLILNILDHEDALPHLDPIQVWFPERVPLGQTLRTLEIFSLHLRRIIRL